MAGLAGALVEQFAEHSPATRQQIADRLAKPQLGRWLQQVERTGFCARPIRLKGSVIKLDGQLDCEHYTTADEPDRELMVRCKNRRAAVCPSCSREYAGDMWQLLAAGTAGGRKGVPETVARHPMAFVTLTAPGFGPVHTRRTGKGTTRCRPRRGRDRALCGHGQPTWCMHEHGDGDPRLGEPLCADCYDYQGAVWFNWCAPALWQRFTVALRRRLAGLLSLTEKGLHELVRVQYAKVAEFQRRGLVHFHAIVRLDGPGDDYPAPVLDVPDGLLADAVRQAAGRVRVEVPPWCQERPGLALGFGAQTDVRRVHDRVGLQAEISPEAVAGYIAKYSTKAAEEFGLGDRLYCPDDLDYRDFNVCPHARRIVETVWQLGEHEPAMRRWLHMLGFRGHFASKSRRYSVTLTSLRHARRPGNRRAEENAGPVEHVQADDDEQTTLVLSEWEFAGLGYRSNGDAVLAAMIAAKAREHD